MPEFEPSTFATHEEELTYLAEQGFGVNPLNKKTDSLEEIWVYQQEMQGLREKVAYPIDGLVVKLNDNQLATALGAVGKTPRGWCAIKFPAEEKPTKLLGVTWQVGRTGRVTPVADLEPVQLAGSTVARATVHNYKEFQESGYHCGDTLVVRKAGDIIPEVVRLLENLRPEAAEKLAAPASCPSCGESLSLSETEVDLLCLNTEKCPEQVKSRLSYFASRKMANIAGLSEKIIEKFIREFGVHDIYDLYRLDWDKVAQLEGFGEKSARKLQAAVEKSRSITDVRFLASLGIEGVGEEVAKLILEHLYEKEQNSTA